jgi:hypothetical protein
VYDKSEEVRFQNRRRAKVGKVLLPLPPANLTRVERQTSGNGLITGTETLGGLLENAPALEPFSQLRFVKSKLPCPIRADLKPGQYSTLRAFQADVEADGLQRTLQNWRKRDPHFARVYDRMSQLFLPSEIPAPDLNRMYQTSVSRQLGLLTGTQAPHFGNSDHSTGNPSDPLSPMSELESPAMIQLPEPYIRTLSSAETGASAFLSVLRGVILDRLVRPLPADHQPGSRSDAWL